MIKKQSAGILLFRFANSILEFFLVHPGGPFWKKKDEGVWSIPKGEFAEDEQPLDAAIREFREETGVNLEGNFLALTPIRQKAGKLVYAWAIKGNLDAETISCNTFQIEWPPKSGNMQSFPEIDKANWFTVDEAKKKIIANQSAFIDELIQLIDKL